MDQVRTMGSTNLRAVNLNTETRGTYDIKTKQSVLLEPSLEAETIIGLGFVSKDVSIETTRKDDKVSNPSCITK